MPTTDPTPAADLDEIERAFSLATGGRWRVALLGSARPDSIVGIIGDGRCIAIVADSDRRMMPLEDATAICAMRNAADYLLRAARERDQLREELRLTLVLNCRFRGCQRSQIGQETHPVAV